MHFFTSPGIDIGLSPFIYIYKSMVQPAPCEQPGRRLIWGPRFKVWSRSWPATLAVNDWLLGLKQRFGQVVCWWEVWLPLSVAPTDSRPSQSTSNHSNEWWETSVCVKSGQLSAEIGRLLGNACSSVVRVGHCQSHPESAYGTTAAIRCEASRTAFALDHDLHGTCEMEGGFGTLLIYDWRSCSILHLRWVTC